MSHRVTILDAEGNKIFDSVETTLYLERRKDGIFTITNAKRRKEVGTCSRCNGTGFDDYHGTVNCGGCAGKGTVEFFSIKKTFEERIEEKQNNELHN